MNTQSHVLMGAFFFGRKVPRTAWAAAAGGLLPDLPMFVIVGILRATGYSFDDIFGRLYWSNWWQICNAIGHNIILWTALLAIALYTKRHKKLLSMGKANMLLAFSASALLHSCVDFFVHREDAHMHFWPLSNWKFVSPVSYYDRAHFGGPFSLFEAVIGIFMAVSLFRTFKSKLVRAALALCIAMYAAIPVFFFYQMSHG
jgi:hypothetical protein